MFFFFSFAERATQLLWIEQATTDRIREDRTRSVVSQWSRDGIICTFEVIWELGFRGLGTYRDGCGLVCGTIVGTLLFVCRSVCCLEKNFEERIFLYKDARTD